MGLLQIKFCSSRFFKFGIIAERMKNSETIGFI